MVAMRTTVNVPWWALPFYALIWLASAIVQAVIVMFVLVGVCSAKALVWVAKDLGQRAR